MIAILFSIHTHLTQFFYFSHIFIVTALLQHIKLNDFNNAEIFEFNPRKNEYCLQSRCYGGHFRSPEELSCVACSEQMDTYSMGNTIYVLLTGLWPFYEQGSDTSTLETEIADASHPRRPFVDDRYRGRSAIEDGLIHVMEQTWVYQPEKRITIFDVVRQLREIKKQIVATP
jgi:serine/threonine protein kinase